MVTPGRQIEVQTPGLHLIAGPNVLGRADQIRKTHLPARQEIQIKREITLSLGGGIVGNRQRAATPVIVPGEAIEVAPGRIPVPGWPRLPEMENAVVHFGPPKTFEKQFIKGANLRIDSL